MARFCPQCGASVTEGGKFCSSCGAKLEESSQPEQAQSQVNLSKQDAPSAEQNNVVQNPPPNQNTFTQNPPPNQNEFFVDDVGVEAMFLKRTGRLNRLRFIQRILALAFAEFIGIFIIVGVFVNDYGMISNFGNLLMTFLVIAGLVPEYCLMVRRLYDLNQNDMLAKVSVGLSVFVLIYSLTKNPFDQFETSDVEVIIGLAQFAFIMYLCCAPGVKGSNQYGPDPLG